ncbi:type II toxin-antitoxin system prevent-host-death family antitoxin [Spiribacter roseus]|uniref:type II toxin-antitoxin system prevent-host-death family antitoxin n=1 Tax=Spiribacter roseus TaxID=1855875 RepID=UPI0013302FCF|nr:type II toxin-antitoxin system prevent-host-death family antitoxin [Spiribacter roseus]KAF0283467.1 prevent-host-death protein [Spiribacter roseus]
MAEKTWSLYEAKNRFSAVVDASMSGEAQWVTRRGERVSVVISAQEYERLTAIEKGSAPGFASLLLDMPQDDGEFERLPLQPRDVQL